jgi:hypothetical protein
MLLTTESNNEIKTIWNIIEKWTAKLHAVGQVPFLLVKFKDSNDMANAFNNFLITTTEKLNTQKYRQDTLSPY